MFPHNLGAFSCPNSVLLHYLAFPVGFGHARLTAENVPPSQRTKWQPVGLAENLRTQVVPTFLFGLVLFDRHWVRLRIGVRPYSRHLPGHLHRRFVCLDDEAVLL